MMICFYLIKYASNKKKFIKKPRLRKEIFPKKYILDTKRLILVLVGLSFKGFFFI